MKHHLLTGVAVAAALAFSAPVWAQGANPSGGNAVGSPGPNPGGPALTPYSSGPNPGGAALSGPRTTPSTPPAAMAPSAMPPSSRYDNTSATPPSYPGHRHARHYAKGHYAKAGTYQRGKGYPVNGTSADQLNQEELGRLQAGNYSNPPAPGYPNSPPPNYSGSPPPAKSYPSGSAPRPYQPPMGTTGGGAPYRP
jgi:hypothetical protein